MVSSALKGKEDRPAIVAGILTGVGGVITVLQDQHLYALTEYIDKCAIAKSYFLRVYYLYDKQKRSSIYNPQSPIFNLQSPIFNLLLLIRLA